MIDFSRIYCKSHPYQIITNFCTKQECLVGLCATCVCSHNNFHLHNNTNADYQNIRFTFSEMHQRVRNQIQEFDNQKVRISALRLAIEKKKNQVRSALIEARKQCLEVVNLYFDNFTKEVNQMMENQSLKSGYHNQQRFDTLSNYLTKQVNKLIESAQELNSKQFLNNIKPIRKEILPYSYLVHRQISYQLQENQGYSANIQINKGILNDIQLCLKKMFIFKFDYPTRQHPRILQFKNNYKQSQNKLVNQLKTQKSLDMDPRTRQSFFKEQSSPLSISKIYAHNSANNTHCGTFSKLPTTIVVQNNSTINPNKSVTQNLSILRQSNSLQKTKDTMNTSIIKIQTRCMSPSNTIIKPYNSILRNSNFNRSYTNNYCQYKNQINDNSIVITNINKKVGFIPQYVEDKNDFQSQSQQIKKNSKKKLTLYSNERISNGKENKI